MSLSYNDLNDLIQNQRALAELVNDIKEHYDAFQTDIEFARSVDAKIQQLNTDMTATMDRFSGQMADLDTRMQTMLTQLQADAQTMKDTINEWMSALQIDAEGHPAQVSKLVGDIVYLTNLVLKGVELPDHTWTGGMEDLNERLKALEARNPSLVIYEDGPENDIPITERLSGVLYGRKTNQVTDIQSGQVIKISPYMQGVIVEDD